MSWPKTFLQGMMYLGILPFTYFAIQLYSLTSLTRTYTIKIMVVREQLETTNSHFSSLLVFFHLSLFFFPCCCCCYLSTLFWNSEQCIHSIVWPSKLTHTCILHFSLYVFQRCTIVIIISFSERKCFLTETLVPLFLNTHHRRTLRCGNLPLP